MDLPQIKSIMRSVCTSYKGSVPLTEFERDYKFIVGEPIPFKAFGHPNLMSMLESLHDVVKVDRSQREPLIREVPTADTHHLTSLVGRQKSDKKSKATVKKHFNKNVKSQKPKPSRRPPFLNIQRTVKQYAHPRIPSPAPTPTTYSDKAKHTFEVSPQFQKLAHNTAVRPVTRSKVRRLSSGSSSGSRTPPPLTRTISNELAEVGNKKELEEYAKIHSLKVYPYKTILFKIKRGVSFYCSTIKVGNHQYSTYPEELKNQNDAEHFAAKIALDELKSEEKFKNPMNGNSNYHNSNQLIDRILEIVGNRTTGVFNIGIEKEYREKYKENLPNQWLQTITNNCSSINVEKVDSKRSILYPNKEEQVRREISPEHEPVATNNSHRKIKVQRPSSTSSNSSSGSTSRSEVITPPPLVLPGGDTFDVFVTRITSPKDIVVRLADYSTEYEELANDMDMYYMDKGKVASSVEINKVYAAKIDASWHRVGILSLSIMPGQVQCVYLDHGEVDYIESSKLHILEDQFRLLPYQALRCQLDGVDALVGDNNAYLHLIEMAHGKTFVAQIIDRDEPVSVILFDTSTDEDININDKLISVTSKIKVAPELPKVGGIQEVYLCHVNLDGTIFVNIDSPFFAFLQEEMASAINKAENNEGVVNVAQKQRMYLAKYDEDNSWYRAVILDVNPLENNVKVEFIDYGNTETISVTNLRDLDHLSDTLTSLPYQAIPCCLHSLPPDGYEWTQEAIDKLTALAPSDQPLLLKVVARQTHCTSAVVELFKRNERNELVSINTTLLVSIDLFKEAKDVPLKNGSNNSSRRSSGNLSLPSPIPFDVVEIKVPAPDIPVPGEYFDVNVILAANPFNFTCQPWRTADSLKELMEEMQIFYNIIVQQLNNDKLSTGMFFAAKHTDGLWYRIFVQDIISQNPVMVSVYFIDYGDYAVMPSSLLLPLKNQFRELPYMAVKAKLHDIDPMHGDWTPMDCVKFQQMVVGKEFVSKIKEKSVDLSSGLSVYQIVVSLVDTSVPGKDVYIEKELVKNGIAKRSS